MRRWIATIILLFVVSSYGLADEQPQVTYVGGSAPGMKQGTMGRLDTTQSGALIFESSAGKITIPYDSVTSSWVTTKLAHAMGVLPTVAVGLLLPLHRKHFLQIAYRDPDRGQQVAVFQIPQQLQMTLMPLLQAHGRTSCRPASPCAAR